MLQDLQFGAGKVIKEQRWEDMDRIRESGMENQGYRVRDGESECCTDS